MYKKSLDLLMVFPSGGDLHQSNFDHHLGSAYVLTYIKKNGFNAEQFISDESFNVKELVKKIANKKPKIVGFTVFERNYMQCILISKGLKAFNPEIIVIFGGPTPSVQSQEILESIKSVDICVRWEGEETMLNLLINLSTHSFNLNKSDLDKIKGITYRKGNQVIINLDSNILSSNRVTKNYIDKYPSPYLSKIIPVSKASPIGILTARGCNQNCVYCNCAIMSKRNIFFHSTERVIQELTYLNEQKTFKSAIPINDDSFTILPTRAKKICESIIENDIKLPLSCITRCDTITEELLDLMKQAGFVSVGFSLESAVPRVLREIGKVNPPEGTYLKNYDKEIEFIEKLKSMTSYAKKIGLYPVFVSIMVGLPGETLSDAQKTLELINQLNIDFYSHNKFHIYKGTPIFQNYKKYGYNVTPKGINNKIMQSNNFPFDINKIKLAPKSATEASRMQLDYDTFKILSLNPKRSIQKPFFKNVIINSDIIKPSLVKWLQEYLAINGTIIQLYSSKMKFIELDKKNVASLYNEFSPTLYYEPYYREVSNDYTLLKSGKSLFLGENIGFYLKLKETKSALGAYKKESKNLENTICIDRTINDTTALYGLLIEISNREDSFNYILNSKPLPLFQALCRWSTSQANCQKFETAIIGSEDSIRICCHSDSIGKIGSKFSDLLFKLNQSQQEESKRRNCRDCFINNTCLKCPFPFPLSSKEYCEFKKISNTNETARLINSINILKDLLFQPTFPQDF